MALRICLVTPFAWSQPHDVNEHVEGIARELRGLGHSVTILASSNRAKELAAGRRALLDVVHGFEPGLPSLSYLALRDAQGLAVATFLSAERLSYPPGRAQRDRLLGRLDALVATSDETAQAAAARFAGHYEVISEDVDLQLFRPGRKRKLLVVEWRPNERALARGVLHELAELP